MTSVTNKTPQSDQFDSLLERDRLMGKRRPRKSYCPTNQHVRLSDLAAWQAVIQRAKAVSTAFCH